MRGCARSTGSISTDYHYLHAARADFLRRLGRAGEARAAYERALALVASEAERRFLSGGSPSSASAWPARHRPS